MKTSYDSHFVTGESEYHNHPNHHNDDEQEEIDIAIAISYSMETFQQQQQLQYTKEDNKDEREKVKERMLTMEDFRKERAVELISVQNQHYNRLNGSLLLMEPLLLKCILRYATIELIIVLYKSSKTVQSRIDEILLYSPFKSLYIRKGSSLYRMFTFHNDNSLLKRLLYDKKSIRYRVKCTSDKPCPFCVHNTQAKVTFFPCSTRYNTHHTYNFSITYTHEIKCLKSVFMTLVNSNAIVNVYYNPCTLVWSHQLEEDMQMLNRFLKQCFWQGNVKWFVNYDKECICFNKMDNFTL
jgi:hypothetical protein